MRIVLCSSQAVVVSTPSFRVRSLDQACYIRCINLALDIRDCVSLVGRGSSVVGAPLRNLAKFVYPTLPVSFGDEPKSPLYLVSMPGEVKCPTQGVNVKPVVDYKTLKQITAALALEWVAWIIPT